jgi:hypothetical protein
MELFIESAEDIDGHLTTVRAAAARTKEWVASFGGDPLDLLHALKFETVGFHPVADHALNAIEQINQTFTYVVALSAARLLLERHPEAGGYVLAPGAHMSRSLDIMSLREGLVGAETFAAVSPANNRKLAGDLKKLASRPERHRYVFFASPRYPSTARQLRLERDGIEVWPVATLPIQR